MSEIGERRISDLNETKGLEPEVIEFCRILARILARGAHQPSHQADNCTHESKDKPDMVTKDL